ncbi:MAG TPA: biopolymer transporter ExbD [Terriglobales bacterium]|jgi:biopolymer transport protein ExbD
MAFSGGPNQAEINVTPLIDVLLVLIIVFMVVVSMSQQKGLDAQIPQPATSKDLPPPESTIVVQVEWVAPNQPPAFKINEREIAFEKLEAHLQEIFVGRVEKVAFVKGDKQIDFDSVAQVIDAAHAAGVQKVGLITSEPKQQAQR